MFIGEAPGATEAEEGRGFVGRSGIVLWDLALRYAHLTREETFVANLIPEYTPGNPDPTPEQIAQYGPELDRLIDKVSPCLIVTLGKFSTRHILGNWATMEVCNGRMFRLEDRGMRLCLPIVHPAAGFYNESAWEDTVYGLKILGQYFEGREIELWQPDAHPRPKYKEADVISLTSDPIAIDTEGYRRRPWSLQYSQRESEGFLIWAHDTVRLAIFKEQLERLRPVIIFHHALHDLEILMEMGIDIAGMGLQFEDTYVMSFIQRHEPMGLKTLALRLAGMGMQEFEEMARPYDRKVAEAWLNKVLKTYEDVFPGGRKHSLHRRVQSVLKGEPDDYRRRYQDLIEDFPVLPNMPLLEAQDIPKKVFLAYANRDPDATLRVYNRSPRFWRSCYFHDVGRVPLLVEMQQTGMPINHAEIQILESELGAEMAEIEKAITAYAGHPVSCSSPPQLSKFLFTELGLPPRWRTESGADWSTDDDVLKIIRKEHPVIDLILMWKAKHTLSTHFVRDLPKWIVDGRVYPNLKNCSQVSGRCGCEKPPLQNFPVTTDDGKRVRRLFKAPEGFVFLSADYSQIELRIAAIESGDQALLQTFKDGRDLHEEVQVLLGLQHRRDAKIVNFRILYLGGPEGLLEKFESEGVFTYTLEDCEEFISKWYERYSGVRDYAKVLGLKARQSGLVEGTSGRVRYLPKVHFKTEWPSGDGKRKGMVRAALREAGNFPIQEGAHTYLSMHCPNVHRTIKDLREEGIDTRACLIVHDELVFLTPEDSADQVGEIICEAMTKSQGFEIPITADFAWARTWGDIDK